MSALAPERTGLYVRALAAGLDALAPDAWYVSSSAARAHLAALDPAVSGNAFLPGGHVPSTGMPQPAWLGRALAEQRAALRDRPEPSKRALHDHLRHTELLEPLAMRVVARRVDPPEVELLFDRIAPDGHWERLRAELRPDRRSDAFVLGPSGRVEVDESVRHVLARQIEAPLAALHAVLADIARGEVVRLGRGRIGPFWFPGVPIPTAVPPELGAGLILHAAREVLLRGEGSVPRLDPLAPDGDPGRLPPGTRLLRARRFAATADRLPALHAWLDGTGARASTAAIVAS